MSIDRLKAKLGRLRELGERQGEAALQHAEAAVEAAVEDLPSFVTSTSTFRGALILDVVYACLRHRAWINNELFGDALAAFLAGEYRLAASTAESLVKKVLSTLGADALTAADNKEFLRYLFVMSATTSDEASLVFELGLGKELLARVSAGLEPKGGKPAPDGASARAGAVFAAPLDADIADALAELAAETGADPGALDAERLRFALFEADQGASTPLASVEARRVFAVLVELGVKRMLPEIALEAALAHAIGEAKASVRTKRLLASLVGAGLVFAAQSKRWELTPEGQALTALAFAAAFGGEPMPDFTVLAQLNAQYQEKVIERHPAFTNDELLACVVRLRPLAPRTLQALIKRIAASGDDAAVARLRADVSSAKFPPWLADAAKGALAAIGQTTSSVANSAAATSAKAVDRRLLER